MPEEEEDHHAKMREHLATASKALDSANDRLDLIESKLPTVLGGDPLPRRRPRQAPKDDNKVLSPLGGGAK